MAALPLFVFPSASSRNKTLNPAFALTPPWQVMHFLFRIGFTCELKSIRASGVRNQEPAPITARANNGKIAFLAVSRFIMAYIEDIPGSATGITPNIHYWNVSL